MQPRNVETTKAHQLITIDTDSASQSDSSQPPVKRSANSPDPQTLKRPFGFTSGLFEIDPGVLALMLGEDTVATIVDGMTLELTYWVFVGFASYVSWYAYRTHKEKYGESSARAAFKSAICFTALMLPGPTGAILAIPSGIAQYLRNQRNDR